MASKMVTDRQKSSLAVEQAGAEHAEAMAASLAGLLGPVLRDGEVLPDFHLVGQLFARTFDSRRQALVAADEAHLAQLAAERRLRRRRDGAARRVYAALVAVRRATNGLVHDRAAADEFGLVGSTPDDPVVLQRQAEATLAKLRKPAEALALSPLAGLESVLAGLADQLAAPLAELADTLAELPRVARASERALVAKRQALAAHDELFGRGAAVFAALFAAAGLTELARRVRPSVRRPGRTVEADDEPEAPTPPPATDGDPPVASVP